MVSDGEDFTPATSNAVTPAPSDPSKATPGTSATKPRGSSRLVIELPSDSEDDEVKPKGFSSRPKRPRQPRASYVDDPEYEEVEPGMDLDDPSLKLALQLQREEDHQSIMPLTSPSLTGALPSTDTPPRRSTRSTRSRSSLAFGSFFPALDLSEVTDEDMAEAAYEDTDEEDDGDSDDDVDADDTEDTEEVPPTSNVTNSKGKGKGKAKPNPQRATIKRSKVSTAGHSEARGSSAPARKRRRISSSAQNQGFPQRELDPFTYSGYLSDDGLYSDENEGDDHAATGRTSEKGSLVHGIPVDTYKELTAKSRRPPGIGGHALRMWKERIVLEYHHPELQTMWTELEDTPVLKVAQAEQPKSINRILKPFQLEGLSWMRRMEETRWRGGLLGDEMGLGKTIQAVSLIMSDYPAKMPSLVLVPPVALMQWTNEIESYTDGQLKTLVFHGTNSKAKNLSMKQLKAFDVILMSYNSLESLYRKQEKGFKRNGGLNKEKSLIHQIQFHRIILDEAHCIKVGLIPPRRCFYI